MSKTYRQLHRAQQEGEYPNVGNSPFGFDWHDLPSLARINPDVVVTPEQQQQQQQDDSKGEDSNNQEQQQQQQDDSKGEDSNNQEQQQQQQQDDSKGEDEDAIPSADDMGDMADDEGVPTNLPPVGHSGASGEAGEGEEGEGTGTEQNGVVAQAHPLDGEDEDGEVDVLSPIVGEWDYQQTVPNVGKYGGFFMPERVAVTPDDATRLMKRALSKLSGGFATNMTPLWDYAKLIKRVATRQDFNLAKKEQDGNPSVLFIGDTSGSCQRMIVEMQSILMKATSMGVRGSDVWLLLASNANVYDQGDYRLSKTLLYRNGKELDYKDYILDKKYKKYYEERVMDVIDAIRPQIVINVGDRDSEHVIWGMLERCNVRTLHIYAPNYEYSYGVTYPVEYSTPIHPDVNMVRILTSHQQTNGTINMALVGKEGRYHSERRAPLSYRIAYAVDFFFSPEKMSQLPIVQFKYV